MDSSLPVTSASTVRAEPFILKLTVIDGNASDGDSFTGNFVAKAHPNKAIAIKITMTENGDIGAYPFLMKSMHTHYVVKFSRNWNIEFKIIERKSPDFKISGPVIL